MGMLARLSVVAASEESLAATGRMALALRLFQPHLGEYLSAD